MSEYKLIERNLGVVQSWFPPKNYRFAQGNTYAPISLEELGRVASSFIIVFKKESTTYSCVALLGSRVHGNSYLDSGYNWTSNYIPFIFRAFPFRIGSIPSTPDNKYLCIHKEHYYDRSRDGYICCVDEDGNLDPLIQQTFNLLLLNEQGHLKVNSIVNELDRSGLLVPASSLDVLSGIEGEFEGDFYVVDEQALDNLPDDIALNLCRNGGMKVACMQLVSLNNFNELKEKFIIRKDDKDVEDLIGFGANDNIESFNWDDLLD